MKTLSILTIAAALTLAISSEENMPNTAGAQTITFGANEAIDAVIDDITSSAKTFRDWNVVICGQGRFFFMFDETLENTDDCVVVDVF